MEVIPDVISEISHRLATLSDGGQVAAIFTTGGTGVAPRDVTPEATRAVLDREIPGLGELMRTRGRVATPLHHHGRHRRRLLDRLLREPLDALSLDNVASRGDIRPHEGCGRA